MCRWWVSITGQRNPFWWARSLAAVYGQRRSIRLPDDKKPASLLRHRVYIVVVKRTELDVRPRFVNIIVRYRALWINHRRWSSDLFFGRIVARSCVQASVTSRSAIDLSRWNRWDASSSAFRELVPHLKSSVSLWADVSATHLILFVTNEKKVTHGVHFVLYSFYLLPLPGINWKNGLAPATRSWKG